ncbi:carbohydrate kinase [Pseudarthrobacter sulfonivorans]|uniref:PfkB family carbohydrate kinase n=1 Tax=Pseudarthrobacter sulfonivorans TaxID=121292 RepID=UPI00168B61B9|nr:PfkB family carbohydrate kinase [Pseudarthrobacter sulfonivorans]
MITVIGESLVDIISGPHREAPPHGTSTQAHPGGSPLNVAVGTARLGLATTLVTHYADDPYGDLIEGHLNANGVAAIRGGSAPTSTATATLSPDGAATYAFNISWDINGAALPALDAVQRSRHVHTGSIAAAVAPGDQATLALLAAAGEHASISYDPNCRPGISPDVAAARGQAERFVAASDIVKASDEDLAWLYPDRTPEQSLSAWLELGPAVVAMTRGAAGPVILSRHGRVEMAAEAITVADTVGAGDSFMAALIAGLDQLKALGAAGRPRLHALMVDDLRSLAAYANRAAAITCSRPGANPPDSTELGTLSVPLQA